MLGLDVMCIFFLSGWLQWVFVQRKAAKGRQGGREGVGVSRGESQALGNLQSSSSFSH